MSSYRCLIRGENFVVLEDGQRKFIGFFTTRIVEAENVEEAETIGLGLLKQDEWLESLRVNRLPDDPPATVNFDEVERVDGLEGESIGGFTFFEME